jgi:hypothetical protein
MNDTSWGPDRARAEEILDPSLTLSDQSDPQPHKAARVAAIPRACHSECLNERSHKFVQVQIEKLPPGPTFLVHNWNWRQH